MKKIWVLLVILVNLGGYAQTPIWQWAKSGKCSKGGAAEGWFCASDASGNVYLTGWSDSYESRSYGTDSMIFGSDSLPNIDNNSYLVKYDKNGNVKWAKASVTPHN